ncbi:MAG: precorrin-6A/cobalt-precorrin-6A reductase [Synechococcaceae cyanobacterium ELA263]
MHALSFHQSAGPARPQAPWLWLIAGTGEGPQLATALLQAGWQLRVSVVSRAAARAYAPQPGLQLVVGAIGSSDAGATPLAGVRQELAGSRTRQQPFRWVIDASHPFASRITAALVQGCGEARVPLLRLQRPELAGGTVELLADLNELGGQARRGERWLLAIGARRLAEAVHQTPEALHHARILPRPQALQQAMAAGLPAERVACLQPLPAGAQRARVEQALCRRWKIETVLCRRSGGPGEAHWRAICRELGLRLLLLERPAEPGALLSLPLQQLLERVGLATQAVGEPSKGQPSQEF